MTNIFIDTSALKAVFDHSDQYHRLAWNHWQQQVSQPVQFIASNYILSETFTLFKRQAGLTFALKLRDKLAISQQSLKIFWYPPVLEPLTWQYFIKLSAKTVSHIDCTSFALMQYLKIKTAFTFDSDFRSAGYMTVPELD